MKQAWVTKPLGEILSVLRNGLNCKQSKVGNGDRISRIESISGAILDLTKVGFSELNESERQRFLLKRGDILFSHINSPIHVGKTAIVDTDVEIYHGVNLLLMRPTEEVMPLYLNLALKYLFQAGYWVRKCKKSVNQASVNQQDISRVEISFPSSLDEQRRIVAILDDAFAGIATAKANTETKLESIGDLFAGLTQQLFPQDSHAPAAHSLDELCEAIIDCEHKTAPTQADGIPSIRTPNIGKGELLLDGVYRVSEETYKEWTRRAEPSPGDLILAREAPAGNVAVIPEGARVCLGQRTVLLKPKREVFEPSYLAHLLLQKNSQERLLAHSRGATVQHINVKDIRNFKVASLPALEEQRSVVAQLRGLGAKEQLLQKNLQRKLAALEALKQSLLHQAFSGQL